ncbi:MAG: LLM class F420-dependent oxidoreductase [Nocardioidaceae bacterium]|nr:LLM class F420-dependent oxidoreductase [Nocardioidaceae bacterium]
MRLGLNVGYVAGPDVAERVETAVLADELGYDVVWAAEAYGSDAPTLLSWIGARTSRIDLGSAIMQIPARTPAMTAMTAATLDRLSEGRFRLGLGVSGPQVSEGWHGVRFEKPLARTREYVEIVRAALARETVRHEGEFFTLPLPDGPGKALKLMLHPQRADLPVYLASVGPKNLELTGEIADGWLAIFFAPEHASVSLDPLDAGLARAGRGRDGFDVVATVPVVVGDDLETCAAPLRPYTALYVGGMGSRKQNFYNALARRMGFDDAAQEVQDLYLDHQPREAAAAVPFELIDQTALIGPRERIAERLHAYAEAGATTIAVSTFGETHDERAAVLRTMADALDASGLGE